MRTWSRNDQQRHFGGEGDQRYDIFTLANPELRAGAFDYRIREVPVALPPLMISWSDGELSPANSVAGSPKPGATVPALVAGLCR
jgi:hypothetical protein